MPRKADLVSQPGSRTAATPLPGELSHGTTTGHCVEVDSELRKFPRTQHMSNLGSATRDDLVMTPADAASLLGAKGLSIGEIRGGLLGRWLAMPGCVAHRTFPGTLLLPLYSSAS